MGGLRTGSDLGRWGQTGEFEINDEAIFRNCFRLHANTDFLTALQRSQVVRAALGDRNDEIRITEKVLHADPGRRERRFVGLMAKHEVVGKKHDASGISVA